MIVLSIISCMALLFSRYYPKKNVSIGLKWAFILLALVSGIRYNYGNDYINYGANTKLTQGINNV